MESDLDVVVTLECIYILQNLFCEPLQRKVATPKLETNQDV